MKDFSLEVHGCRHYDATGAISQPIYASATFRHPGFRQSTGYDYSRVINPTREQLEKHIALLERGSKAWAFSCGMAAISTILRIFVPGDHILLSEDLYGGTVRLASEIYARYGIQFEYVDTADDELVQSHLRPETKGLFIETPSNPMMKISDIRALARLAHQNGAWLIVDNTFLSPHFQRPLELDADFVVHSGTKYLCGHNDVLSGFVIARESSPAADTVELCYKSEGATLDPFSSWLMLRSLKTLGLRVERQAANAARIVAWLQTNPLVREIFYPGLPCHPGHTLQLRQASGFGGMISFKVQSAAIARQTLSRLKLIAFAESLGGVESLLTYPIEQTHKETPPELLARTGVDDCLLRLSVGIEDAEDLIADLDQAIRKE